ncbi:DUF308 domain-containing protein [Erwinia sp. MMLR14_017]|uniref:DUF308 domain-containing protein n=1 Tax=Erwinia sp. MMLR14_017 TaxID=3093842 RepID=UPI00298FF107|nr:DUF308 domain-containing protein [Erwinia sp. MMLR14_017]MDW8844559.1 DUF308 domain-containing protein [Erwinia sp. MMLR14_017]
MLRDIRPLQKIPSQYWLRKYYFSRALFSLIWVAAAFSIGQHSSYLAAILLIIYPAWDALANYIDSTRSGGISKNRMQAFNIIVSIITTVSVIFTVRESMNQVIAVFGCWAILSGLLQLGAAVQRWKNSNAQWSMALSGGQSTIAGAFFIFQAQMPVPPSIINIAGYAAFGAFYFLVSAVSLFIILRKKNRVSVC